MFEKFGDVGDIYMPTERGTGRSRGFAFVRFYDKRDAEVSLVKTIRKNTSQRAPNIKC